MREDIDLIVIRFCDRIPRLFDVSLLPVSLCIPKMLLMHCWYDRDTALHDNVSVVHLVTETAKLIPVAGKYILVVSCFSQYLQKTAILRLTGTMRVSRPMTIAGC